MRRTLFAVVLTFFLLLAGCTSEKPSESGKLKVAASFFPIYEFASKVGGDKIELIVLIPGGVEPHEYEPSVGDMRKISESDLLLINGAGMEPWAETMAAGIDNSRLVIVDTSKDVELFSADHHSEEDHEDLDLHETEGDAHTDPHVWLSPKSAKLQVAAIAEAFSEADPGNSAYYRANAANYSAELDRLDSDIDSVFTKCEKKDILITHATMGYFCRDYGCNQIAITGVNPEAEPSPADLAKIINQARALNVSSVFFEKLINPKSAEIIALEIGGEVYVFDSVHGLTEEEKAAGEGYISLMEGNLAQISEALGCK